LQKRLASGKVQLNWHQMCVGPDGYTLGIAVRHKDGVGATFLAARHMSTGLCTPNSVCVEFAPADVPTNCAKVEPATILERTELPLLVQQAQANTLDHAVDHGTPCREARPVSPWTWHLVLAWSVHLVAFYFVFYLIIHIFTQTKADRERNLVARSIDEEEWREEMLANYAFSLVQSLVLVDGLKVLLLALTSPPWLEAMFGKKRTRIIVKPARKLHKLLDVFV